MIGLFLWKVKKGSNEEYICWDYVCRKATDLDAGFILIKISSLEVVGK